MSAYRQPPHVPDPGSAEDEVDECPDKALVPVFIVLWVGSVARVALGVDRHEMFGTEGTLAFLAVLLVPYAMRDAIRWGLARLWSRISRL